MAEYEEAVKIMFQACFLFIVIVLGLFATFFLVMELLHKIKNRNSCKNEDEL